MVGAASFSAKFLSKVCFVTVGIEIRTQYLTAKTQHSPKVPSSFKMLNGLLPLIFWEDEP